MKIPAALFIIFLFVSCGDDQPMKTIRAVDNDAYGEELADSLAHTLDSVAVRNGAAK